MEPKKMEVGIQFWPWYDLNTLLEFARQALKESPFDQIWMCDEFQYEDTSTVLAAMANDLDASLGTMVTFPWRNPLELAQRFASISKLLPEGRHVAAGIGAGGAVQEQVVAEKTNPMDVVQESILLLRGLFSGKSVPLAEFPRLSERFRYNPQARARLYFPPAAQVPVILAAGGPKTCRMAGRLADGVILTQIHPRTCATAMPKGMFESAIKELNDGLKERQDGSFKKIYNLHLSVSADGRRARDWAKRNTSYGVASYSVMYPKALQTLGIDPQQAEHVRRAYVEGLGLEEAARRVTDSMLRDAGFIVAGTPDECLAEIRRIIPYLKRWDFDQLVIGVPLGPVLSEAIPLIAREVLPQVMAALNKRD